MLKNNRYDVAIIGAGPAGTAAAYILSGYGMKVCMIDKSTFPRNKLCGGLLTIRAKRLFGDIFNTSWEPVIEYVSDGVKFYHFNKLLNEVKNYKELYFTNRILFDNFLVDLAIQAGSKTYFGKPVVDFDAGNKTITLKDGCKIISDFIVGADGVNSWVSKYLFKKSFALHQIGLGLEIDIDSESDDAEKKYPEIYFGILKWGYGWVFPKKNTLTVGIGGLLKYNPQMTQTFLDFLKTLFNKTFDKSAIKGHYIPFGCYKKIPGRDNIFLCGDAAGLVDPITGEGIAFALKSGKFAGQAIIEASGNHSSKKAIEIYMQKYQTITDEINRASYLRWFLFPQISESIFVKTFPLTDTIPKKYIDLISGDITYSEYIKFLTAKCFKGSIKHLFGLK